MKILFIQKNFLRTKFKKLDFLTERNEKVNDIEFAPLSVTKNGVVDQLEHVVKDNSEDKKKF